MSMLSFLASRNTDVMVWESINVDVIVCAFSLCRCCDRRSRLLPTIWFWESVNDEVMGVGIMVPALLA